LHLLDVEVEADVEAGAADIKVGSEFEFTIMSNLAVGR
jgi:hypothetical protein